MHIHVIHENDEWTAPLLAELAAARLPYVGWHLAEGRLALDEPPPPGVFYSRMSASSHTRGHRYAPELTACVLAWLEAAGARVLNGTRALALEVSKAAQYAALARAGIPTPRTVAAVGRAAVLEAAEGFDGAFITKHNRAGKGLGVHLFQRTSELARALDDGALEPPVDGVWLLQAYVRAPTPHITRVELVGQELLYAVRVDTSEGFELCPADACAVGDAFCPAGADAGVGEKFAIIDGFDHPLVPRYRRFMRDNAIAVAAFEFIEDGAGNAYTYDVNTNTNYNSAAEARAGVSGMRRLAAYLGEELARAAEGERRVA